MTAQRWTGFALVMLQVVALSYLSRDVVMPLLAAGVALAGMIHPLRLRLTLWRRVIPALVLALVVGAKLRLMPDAPRDNLIMGNGLGTGLAHYMLLLQASLFHLEALTGKDPLRLPKTLPAYAAAVLGCAGDVAARGIEISAYQMSAVAFVLLTVIYISVSDGHSLFLRRFPMRTAVAAVLLLVVGSIGWTSSWLLGEHWREIDDILFSKISPKVPATQTVGFSGSARLGSVAHTKTSGEDKAALRVFASTEPGYMRGRAFVSFDGKEWDPDPAERELKPEPSLPAEPKRPHEVPAKAYRVGKGAAPWDLYEVWTAANFPVAFTPLGTGILAASTDRLKVSNAGIPEGKALTQYAAYVPQAPSPAALAEDLRTSYTAVPSDLDPGIRALAVQLFRDCETAAEKTTAVERYFHTQYKYDLGIQVPPGEEPLTYFLLKKPAAHCEYFASGATILLRLGGVPCRYVTGFVASEHNLYGGYWVARNRDAHAWAEAYDDATGWRIVEATPSSGVPQSRPAANERMDYLRFWWRGFTTVGLLGALKFALATVLGYLLPVGAGGAILAGLWLFWRRLRAKGLPALFRRGRAKDPMVALLNRMDKMVAKRGFTRAPSETLHRYADRLCSNGGDPFLSTASDWYRIYAEVRYSNPTDSTAYAELLRSCAQASALSVLKT